MMAFHKRFTANMLCACECGAMCVFEKKRAIENKNYAYTYHGAHERKLASVLLEANIGLDIMRTGSVGVVRMA